MESTKADTSLNFYQCRSSSLNGNVCLSESSIQIYVYLSVCNQIEILICMNVPEGSGKVQGGLGKVRGSRSKLTFVSLVFLLYKTSSFSVVVVVIFLN